VGSAAFVAAMAACTVACISSVAVGVGDKVGDAAKVSVEVGLAGGIGESVALGAGVSVVVAVAGSGVAATTSIGSEGTAGGVYVGVLAMVKEGTGVAVSCPWATRIPAKAVCVASIAFCFNSVVVKRRVPITIKPIRPTTRTAPIPRRRGPIGKPAMVAPVAVRDATSVAEGCVSCWGGGVGVRSRPGSTASSFTRGADAIVVIGIAMMV
jgi:hypothetical protein